MAHPQIFEGTAEEIIEQLRRSNLTGKLRAIVTEDEYPTSVAEGRGETLDKALAVLPEEAHRVEHGTPVPHSDPQEKAFGEIMDEQYRKTGFTL